MAMRTFYLTTDEGRIWQLSEQLKARIPLCITFNTMSVGSMLEVHGQKLLVFTEIGYTKLGSCSHERGTPSVVWSIRSSYLR